MRYVAKPIEIDAIRWRGRLHDLPVDWRASDAFSVDEIGLVVRTNRGPARVYLDDYILRGTASEYYPVPPAIFEYKYEPAGGGVT